jgi:pimeloyl-ACP methyl ester carboxylesterase
MSFMPFQVLGIWLRAFLALLVLSASAALLYAWNAHRRITVAEVRPAPSIPAAEHEPAPDPARAREEMVLRQVDWQFGLNRATAFLLGGLALGVWGLGGRWLNPMGLARRGGSEPEDTIRGDVQRIRRPDGTELHVELSGPENGTPVVVTHGWGLDRREWLYLKEDLSTRHRVIAWDLPGLGRSSGPANNDWSLEKLAGDLDAVLKLAGHRPAVLVGHSIGGMVILTFCRLFPDTLRSRISGLVIAQSTYTNPVTTTRKAALYTALQKPVLEPMCHLMIWLAPLVWLLNFLSYLNGSAHRSTDRSSFSGKETRGQLNFLTRYTIEAWPAVLARGFLGMFRYDATSTLRSIPVPALVVAGENDSTCTHEASEKMRDDIPRAQLVTLKDARHCGVFEYHGQFNTAVQEFVASCVAAPTKAVG